MGFLDALMKFGRKQNCMPPGDVQPLYDPYPLLNLSKGSEDRDDQVLDVLIQRVLFLERALKDMAAEFDHKKGPHVGATRNDVVAELIQQRIVDALAGKSKE